MDNRKQNISREEIKTFQTNIWMFYKKNKRDLPWRKTTNPYFILVSELMLQQTQVSRVIPKYKAFLKTFPTFEDLARAPLEHVLQIWSGLGYNRRTLYLKQIAYLITVQYLSKIPNDVEVLQTFPGIGKNTACAVCVFSFNKPYVFIETNIRRTFINYFFENQTDIHDKQIFPLIEQTLDYTNPREWYWALMDYGSHLAQFIENPNRKSKHYTKQSPLKGSIREARGRILKILTQQNPLDIDSLLKKTNIERSRFQEALKQLLKENFIENEKETIKIKT